jgi:hypothetical protein
MAFVNIPAVTFKELTFYPSNIIVHIYLILKPSQLSDMFSLPKRNAIFWFFCSSHGKTGSSYIRAYTLGLA